MHFWNAPFAKSFGGQDFNSTNDDRIGTTTDVVNGTLIVVIVIWALDWVFNKKVFILFTGGSTCPSWTDQ